MTDKLPRKMPKQATQLKALSSHSVRIIISLSVAQVLPLKQVKCLQGAGIDF